MAANVLGAAGEMLNGIVQTAETFRELGNHWFEADSSRKEVLRQVKCLEEKSTQWNKLVAKYGLARDEALMESLHYAQDLLTKELQKMRKACGGNGTDETLSRLQGAFFPSTIGQSINKAIQAFDDVQKKLEDQHNAQIAAQRSTLSSEHSRMLSFSKQDYRYVRLEKTEQRVKTALLNSNGHNVILLHGGPGMGKSTLARYLALQIQPGVGAQAPDDITLATPEPAPEPIDINVQSTENQRKARSFLPSLIRTVTGTAKREGNATDMRADGQTSPPGPPGSLHHFSAVLPQSAGSPVSVCDIIDDAVPSPRLVQIGSTPLSEMFDEVVFLECSMDSAEGFVQREPEIVQRELRQKLVGWMDDGKSDGIQVDELQTSLQSLLHEQKVLIILDNVWDPTFLGCILRLLEGNLNVKWLVTSQDEKLCHRFNFSPTLIHMEPASLVDARRIFARHIRRSESGKTIDTIPVQVQGLADELINKVDTNLLAIACLATGIDPKKIDDVEEWKEVRRDCFHHLSAKDTAMIFNVEYPGSYWAAMQYSFRRLDEGVKRLLVLIGICEATSVPQEVLEYLYGKISQGMDFRAFKSAKLDLEAKDLVQLRDNNCSIHDLLRKFVNEHADSQKYKKSILTDLELSRGSAVSESAGPFGEGDILNTVIFLYLKTSFTAEKMDFKIGIHMDCETRRLKRHILEPVTRLLVKAEDDWTANYCRYTRQVFLKYVEEDCVDEEVVGMLFRGADYGTRIAVMEFLGRCYHKTPISHIMAIGEGILSTYRIVVDHNVVHSTLFFLWDERKKQKRRPYMQEGLENSKDPTETSTKRPKKENEVQKRLVGHELSNILPDDDDSEIACTQ